MFVGWIEYVIENTPSGNSPEPDSLSVELFKIFENEMMLKFQTISKE